MSCGPWWCCILDVERLAWNAVTNACRAAQELASSRAMNVEVGVDPTLTVNAFESLTHLRINGKRPEVWSPYSAFFPANDGWVRTHANYPHHKEALTRALGPDIRAVIAETSADDIERKVNAERGVAVTVRTPEEWAIEPHAISTKTEPWVGTKINGSTRDFYLNPTEPLAGVRILDLTRVIAGPVCSQILSCLGADVLRIDPPGRPELAELYLSSGMGKQSVELDFNGFDRRQIDELVESSDVVLLGYRPGALDRFGLNKFDLVERFPHLILASLSAWGECGPWAGRPGFDSVVQAATGIASLCGTSRRPGALPVQVLDHATGYRMAAEILSFLANRNSGTITISLLGAARTLLGYSVLPEKIETSAVLVTPEVNAMGFNVDSIHVQTVPPALTINSRPLFRSLTKYGAADIGWYRRRRQ